MILKGMRNGIKQCMDHYKEQCCNDPQWDEERNSTVHGSGRSLQTSVEEMANKGDN